MEDSPYIPNIDTTLLAIKNRIRRFNHRCPYNNKRLTRRTDDTLNQAEVMQDTIKQRMENETDKEKSKQYAKILKELADYIQPVQTIDSHFTLCWNQCLDISNCRRIRFVCNSLETSFYSFQICITLLNHSFLLIYQVTNILDQLVVSCLNAF